MNKKSNKQNMSIVLIVQTVKIKISEVNRSKVYARILMAVLLQVVIQIDVKPIQRCIVLLGVPQ